VHINANDIALPFDFLYVLAELLTRIIGDKSERYGAHRGDVEHVFQDWFFKIPRKEFSIFVQSA